MSFPTFDNLHTMGKRRDPLPTFESRQTTIIKKQLNICMEENVEF